MGGEIERRTERGVQALVAVEGNVTEPDRRRVVIGFLVAPLAAPILFVLIFVVAGVSHGLGTGNARSVQGVLSGSWVWLVAAVPVSYAVTLIAGLPAYFLMRTFEGATWKSWLAVAAAIGAVAGSLVGAVFILSDRSYGTAAALVALGALFGGVNGWLFWYLAVRVTRACAPGDTPRPEAPARP